LRRAALIAVLLGACEQPAPQPKATARDAAATGVVPPPDAAAVATCLFCGRRWPADTSELECHDPAVVDLEPLTCLPDLAYLSLRGSGARDLHALRGSQLSEIDIGDTAITDAEVLTLVRGDEPHLIVSGTPPPEIRTFDCDTGEGGLRGHEQARHNVITDHLDCAAELLSECDGSATARLLVNTRTVATKKTRVKAGTPVRVALPTQRPPGSEPTIYAISVDLRCGELRRTVSDRFATRFMWGE
jgi:hypothetical protein